MGLKPSEVRKLTMKEFNLMLTGYMARQNREWDRTRHIMAFVATYGGMGASEFIEPRTIYPLPSDRENEKKPIKTKEQALKLLKEFE